MNESVRSTRKIKSEKFKKCGFKWKIDCKYCNCSFFDKTKHEKTEKQKNI